MYDLTRRVMCRLVGEDKVLVDRSWGTGCTDMGDISCVFPAIHPSGSGAEGRGHGDDYRIVDKESALTLAAKFLLAMSAALLGEGAKEAKHILDNKRTPYPSIQAYLKAVDELSGRPGRRGVFAGRRQAASILGLPGQNALKLYLTKTAAACIIAKQIPRREGVGPGRAKERRFPG